MKKRLTPILLAAVLALTLVAVGVMAFAASEGEYTDAMTAINADEALTAKRIETFALAKDGYLGIPVDVTVYFDAANYDVVPGEGGTSLILYVVNTRTERAGTDSDVSIIKSLLDKGYVVAVTDYHNHEKAVSPDIEWSTQEVVQTVLSGKSFTSAEIKAEYAEAFIVPAGHTLSRDHVFWELDRHSTSGTLEKIVEVWNDDFRGVKGKAIIPWHNDGVRKSTQNGQDGTSPVWYSKGTGTGAVTYNGVSYVPDENGLYIMVKHTLATDVTDCVKPDGSPIDLNLYMHIVYPTNPKNEVPVLAIASSGQHLAGVAVHADRPHTYGFAFEGYAVAMYDFAYTPMARDDHYGYFDGKSSGAVSGDSYTYSLGLYNEAYFPTAAMRYIRYLALTEGDTFAFNGKIGVIGNSKGSYVTRLADLDLMDVKSTADGYTPDALKEYADSYMASFLQGRYYYGYGGESRYDAGCTTYSKNGMTVDGGELQPWLVYNGEMIPSGAQFVLSSCGAWDGAFDSNYAPLMTTGHIGIENNGYSTNNQLINAARRYDVPLVWFELVLGHTFLQRECDAWNVDPYVAYKNYAHYVLKDGAPSVICALPLSDEEISATSEFTIRFAGIISESEIAKVTLTDSKGNAVPGVFESGYGRTEWTFVPATALKSGEKYTLNIPDTVVGENGTRLMSSYTATYYTEAGSTADLGISETTVTSGSGAYLNLTVPNLAGNANRIELRLFVADDAANTLEVYLNNASGALLGKIPVGGIGYYSLDLTDKLAGMTAGEKVTLFVKTSRAATDPVLGGESLWSADFESGSKMFATHSGAAWAVVEKEGHGKVLEFSIPARNETNDAKPSKYFSNVQTLSKSKFIFGDSNPVTAADYGRRFVVKFDVYDTTSRLFTANLNSLSSEATGVIDYDADFANFKTVAGEWTTCSFVFSIEEPAYGKTGLDTKTFYIFADAPGNTSDGGREKMCIDNFTVCELVTDVTLGSASLVVSSAGGDAYKAGDSDKPFEVGGSTYATLAEAIAAVGSSKGTVTLRGNVTFKNTDLITGIMSSDLTVDLNGYAIRTALKTRSIISLLGTETSVTLRNGSVYLSGGSLVGFENASAAASVTVTLDNVYIGTERGANTTELLVNSTAPVASTIKLVLKNTDVDMRADRFTKNPVVMFPTSTDTVSVSAEMQGGSIIFSTLYKMTLAEETSDVKFIPVDGEYTKLLLAASSNIDSAMALHTDVGTIPVKETDSASVRNGYREYAPTPAGIKTPYGYIPEEYGDVTLYPWVAFNKDTREFVAASDIFYADTAGANGILGALQGKTGNYAVYLRDNFTYSDTSQNWSSLNCNIIVDLGGKVFTYSGRMRPQSKAAGEMSISFENGEILFNSQYSLLDILVKTKEKSFDFTFKNIVFSVADGVTLPTFWISAVNSATSTGALNYTLTLWDCKFILPESASGKYLFSIGRNASINDSVVIKGCEFVGAIPSEFYLYRNYALNEASGVSLEQGTNGNYITNTRPDGAQAYIPYYADASTVAKLFFSKEIKVNTDGTATYEYDPNLLKTPYGDIPEEYADLTEYPWVAFNKDTKEFVAASNIFYADAAGANGILGALQGKTGSYAVYLRDSFTYTTASQNWSSLNCDILIDLNNKRFISEAMMRPQGKATGTMSVTFANGEIVYNIANPDSKQRPLIDAIAKANDKTFNFTFSNVTFSVAEGATVSNFWLYYGNATASTGGKLNVNLTLEDCRFILPTSGTNYLFSIGYNANIDDHVVVKGCEFVGALRSATYLYRDSGKNAQSTVSFERGSGGYYMTNTRADGGQAYMIRYLSDGTKEKLYFTSPIKVNADGTTTYEYSPSGSTTAPDVSFVSAYLNLTNDLNMVYRTYVAPGCTNPSVTFTIGSSVNTVTSYTVDANGLYCFKLVGVNPAKMNETITAVLTAELDGETVTATHDTLSVKSYLDAVKAGATGSLLDLVNKLLVYGAATQQYLGQPESSFVTEIGELEAIPESEDTLTISGESTESCGFTACGVRLDGAIALRVSIKADSFEGLTLKAVKDGVEKSYRLSDYEAKDGVVTIYYDRLLANELDCDVSFTLVRGGAAVSGTLTFSANAYLYRIGGGTDALATLARALYAYGKSACEYSK